MQEEVTNKTVSLSITTSKLTGRVLGIALRELLTAWRKGYPSLKMHHGKQTVKQLVGQNAGVSNIEITDSNIKSFERVARKYGVDFAVKKDRSVIATQIPCVLQGARRRRTDRSVYRVYVQDGERGARKSLRCLRSLKSLPSLCKKQRGR